MTNKEAIIQAIRQYAIAATGLAPEKVVPSSDPGTGPRPALPYVSILVTATQGRQGTPQKVWEEIVPGAFRYRNLTHHQVVVTVQGYGPGANDLLALLEHCLYDSDALDAIAIDGVRPTGVVASTSDNTGIIATDWEERARLDLFVSFAQTEATPKDTEAAENLVLEADFTEPATATVEQIEVTAP